MRTLLCVLFAFVISGCASTGKNQGDMVSRLQLRVGELEREIDRKQEQINELSYTVKDLTYDIDKLKAQSRKKQVRSTIPTAKKFINKQKDGIVRVSATTKQIQQALKNAGYYNGSIDNKIGNGTKTAISKFQKDNGLNADGIVGEKTWNELKSFID